MVAIHNVVGTHVLQVHSLLLEELQSLVHVLQAVDAHLPLRGLWLGDSRGPMGMEGPHGYHTRGCNLDQLLTSASTLYPLGSTPTPTITP